MNLPERIAILMMVLGTLVAFIIKSDIEPEEPEFIAWIRLGSLLSFFGGIIILCVLFLFNKL